jgi:hypothetical protein
MIMPNKTKWFDFQQDTWSYESQSEISKNFVWCELLKPE